MFSRRKVGSGSPLDLSVDSVLTLEQNLLILIQRVESLSEMEQQKNIESQCEIIGALLSRRADASFSSLLAKMPRDSAAGFKILLETLATSTPIKMTSKEGIWEEKTLSLFGFPVLFLSDAPPKEVLPQDVFQKITSSFYEQGLVSGESSVELLNRLVGATDLLAIPWSSLKEDWLRSWVGALDGQKKEGSFEKINQVFEKTKKEEFCIPKDQKDRTLYLRFITGAVSGKDIDIEWLARSELSEPAENGWELKMQRLLSEALGTKQGDLRVFSPSGFYESVVRGYAEVLALDFFMKFKLLQQKHQGLMGMDGFFSIHATEPLQLRVGWVDEHNHRLVGQWITSIPPVFRDFYEDLLTMLLDIIEESGEFSKLVMIQRVQDVEICECCQGHYVFMSEDHKEVLDPSEDHIQTLKENRIFH